MKRSLQLGLKWAAQHRRRMSKGRQGSLAYLRLHGAVGRCVASPFGMLGFDAGVGAPVRHSPIRETAPSVVEGPGESMQARYASLLRRLLGWPQFSRLSR